MLVCALGDLTLDVLVRLEERVAPGGDVDAEILLGSGGQAANVAAWASELGASSRFLGKRGDDDAARLACEGLAAHGVDVVGPSVGRGAVVCSLVEPGGERSMASDRGAAAELAPDEVDPRWLEGCDHLFVSGYALRGERSRAATALAVELARAEGAGVSVDLSSWIAIRDAAPGSFREAVAALAPDAVFANEDEERALGGPLPGTTWILKRGARGCSFDGEERPALPVERVVDATGAGDALAAGWIVGGPEFALEAAARCVARLGSMP
ncbi:MAG TPA: carbohydrate kinase family protein [Gaiellaceae bacterium]|nr:carbohydrate kinase family protein [Gaiellaceae bacterium]